MLSILHWRCRDQREITASTTVMNTFNTPLEMPKYVTAFLVTPPRRLLSILHWRCYRASCSASLASKSPVFQYSIGDARVRRHVALFETRRCFQYSIGDAALRLIKAAQGLILSILHWRCEEALASMYKGIIEIIFQYSIGDAPASRSQPGCGL